MRKNLRVLNIFCEAIANGMDCGDRNQVESTIKKINEKIKAAAEELKLIIRKKIEDMPTPQKKGFIQRFWSRLNPSSSQFSHLGVLGQIHEQLKTDEDLYCDILILEALYNKEIGSKIFNESAKPLDARIFKLINNAVDNFFEEFKKYVGESASILLDDKKTSEDAMKAVDNLNHIGAATEGDVASLEKKLYAFISGATKEISDAAANNVQRDKNGNPLSFIQRSYNWLTGNRAANWEKEEEINRKEKEYIKNHVAHRLPDVKEVEIGDANKLLDEFYNNFYDKNTKDFYNQLLRYVLYKKLNPKSRIVDIMRMIDIADKRIKERKERYGMHLGAISESNVGIFKNYNKKGITFLADAIASSSKEVFDKLLNDVDFKKFIMSIVMCLRLKAGGSHGSLAPKGSGFHPWRAAVDRFYHDSGLDFNKDAENKKIGVEIETFINSWMDEFKKVVGPPLVISRGNIPSLNDAVELLPDEAQMKFTRLQPQFKHALNIAYNAEYKLPPPPKPVAPAPNPNPAPNRSGKSNKSKPKSAP